MGEALEKWSEQVPFCRRLQVMGEGLLFGLSVGRQRSKGQTVFLSPVCSVGAGIRLKEWVRDEQGPEQSSILREQDRSARRVRRAVPGRHPGELGLGSGAGQVRLG